MTPASKKVQEYRRTVPGLVTLIYANQKMTSKRAGRPLPSYTKDELRSWMEKQPNFQAIFDAWVASNYAKRLSPSIDRIDNTLGYSLTNIQLVAWHENLKNQKKQNKTGEYLHTGSRAIRQLSLDGEVIAVHGSIGNAVRAIGVGTKATSNISDIANGKWQTAYGYKWEWVE